MLSDEERKAIDNMKSLLLYSIEHEYFSPFQEQEIDDMNIVLNIIEKQSKEIEELKDDNKKKSIVIIEYQDLYEKLVDKIKAKIEEYEEILKSPIIKDDYKREVEHIIRVLEELKGDN